ncbi:MAG: hypothetical protein AB8B93_15795 [Pseudomonadales bacterium]
MMFLILKIFVYLCVAMAMGGGAGWLLRHLAAQKETEALQRSLQDSMAKVPKLESMVRARDERIKGLTNAQAEQDEAMKGSRVQDEQAARTLKEKDLEITRLQNRLDAMQQTPGEDQLIAGDLLQDVAPANDTDTVESVLGVRQSAQAVQDDASAVVAQADQDLDQELDGDVDNTLIAGLHNEIERLKEEIATTRIQLEVAQSDDGMQQEIGDLTNRLRQKAEDYDRLQKALQQEQRKVAELERERELQNKSLKVLHQQLEMVRDARS